jgi:hypothetical protein
MQASGMAAWSIMMPGRHMQSVPASVTNHIKHIWGRRTIVRISGQALLSATVLSFLSGFAAAATHTVDPDKLPKVECSSLHFSKEFLNRYPKAPAACQEARIYQGKTYMKVKGKLYVADKPALSFAFEDTYGNALGTVTLKNPRLRVIIDGKPTTIDQVSIDQDLTFWVPDSIFSAQSAAAGQ